MFGTRPNDLLTAIRPVACIPNKGHCENKELLSIIPVSGKHHPPATARLFFMGSVAANEMEFVKLTNLYILGAKYYIFVLYISYANYIF